MALDTTTGAATAESYCSVLQASAYHTARGNAAWAALASDTVREQLLRKATDYIEQSYSQSWQGERVDNIQALSWPRSYVYVNGYAVANDAIPQSLINATAELALRAAAGDLQEDLTRGVVREKVGALEVEYDKSSPGRKRYVAVENMIKPLFSNQYNMYVGLTRA